MNKEVFRRKAGRVVLSSFTPAASMDTSLGETPCVIRLWESKEIKVHCFCKGCQAGTLFGFCFFH